MLFWISSKYASSLQAMPIFNIFQGLISKQSHLYSDFLEAYNEVKQLKHIQNNLKTMAHCLILEKSQGISKCLSYYMLNEVDKVLLNLGDPRLQKPELDSGKFDNDDKNRINPLNPLTPDLNCSVKSLRNKEYSRSTDSSPTHTSKMGNLSIQVGLEPFYISIINIFNDEYLRSDFWNLVWRHGKFSQLCKLYCEKCVEYDIFSSGLALYLAELSLSDPMALEGMVVVCELEKYCGYFESMGFGDRLINKIELYASIIDERCIDLLLFACYYEDRSKTDLLDKVSVKVAINKSDYSGCLNIKNKSLNDVERIEKSEFAEQLRFLSLIFNRVKSKRIRYKVMIEACSVARAMERAESEREMFSSFILECIKIDSLIVGTALCRPEENLWSPLKILNYLLEERSLENHKTADDNGGAENDDTKIASDNRNSILPDDEISPKSFRNHRITKSTMKNKDFRDYRENSNLQISFNFSSTDDKNASEDTILTELENKKRQSLLFKIIGMDIPLITIYLDERQPLRIKRHDACLLEALFSLKISDPRIYIFLYYFDKQTFFNNLEGIPKSTDTKKIINYIKEDLLLV